LLQLSELAGSGSQGWQVLTSIASMVHHDLHWHRGSPVFAMPQQKKLLAGSELRRVVGIELPRCRPQRDSKIDGMKSRILPRLSAPKLLATRLCARAETFGDLWLTLIKPPPCGATLSRLTENGCIPIEPGLRAHA
jgi:hypothetical protein